VLEAVRAFEKASGKKVPYEIVARRSGDVAECWSDPARAEHDLGWKAERGLEAMMEDTWRWQSMNPDGYRTGVQFSTPSFCEAVKCNQGGNN